MREIEPSSTDPVLPFLIILNGKQQGKKFRLEEGQNVFGRDPNGPIFIQDHQISRTHGKITSQNSQLTIEDLGSTNGIFVDGTAITKADISSTSRIQVGNTLLKITFKDATELEIEEELFKAATTDALTGVENRSSFMKGSEQDLAYAKRNRLPTSVVMIDADHFKTINDTHGHQAGDHVLRTLAKLINNEKRTEDRLGRYGGEEFIMLLRGSSGDNTQLFCERLREKISEHEFNFNETSINVSVSIGFYPTDKEEVLNLENMIRKADEALYTAKKSGRNRVECFYPTE